MKNYYERFIQLSQLQCTARDYEIPSKVKAHNSASRQLQQLQEEMKKQNCSCILQRLLSHEDARVRVNAAALCMQSGVLTEAAQSVLEQIAACDPDATTAFSARMILENRSKT